MNARTGFYTALAALINVRDDITVHDIFTHLDKELHKAGSNSKGVGFCTQFKVLNVTYLILIGKRRHISRTNLNMRRYYEIAIMVQEFHRRTEENNGIAVKNLQRTDIPQLNRL